MQPDQPLISVAELARRLDEPTLRVVDCRWYLGRPGAGRAAYDAGHLPGAIHLDIDTDLVAADGPGRHPLPDPGVFATRMAGAGIGDEHLVVAYDDLGGWVAARLWWMLDSLGHRDVQVLDGGIGSWMAAGHPLTTEVRARPAARLSLASAWARTIDRDALRARLGSLRLLDARAGPRFRGETEPIDAVAGHIPTAVNAPTEGNLAPGGSFLSATDLRERFRSLGALGADQDVVTSCGSGVSACHNALAMRAAGLPDPFLYPGSYSDWTQNGLAVVNGLDPGDPPRYVAATWLPASSGLMATRQRPVDAGTERGRSLTVAAGSDLRNARRDRDLSLKEVGAAVGLSESQVSRVERGLVDHVSVLDLARLHAVVGQQLSVKSYPGGSPIRDAPHLELITDFCTFLHASLGWTTEVPMPREGDPRAWDVVVRGDQWRAAIEAETGPKDSQGLVRRVLLKQRDSGMDSVILLLRSTVQTRRFLQDAGAHLRSAFPNDGAIALARLQAGNDPGGNAIIVLPPRHRRSLRGGNS